MREEVFQHPLKYWTIRIRLEAEELWSGVQSIFGLFDEHKVVENTNRLTGDFLIKKNLDKDDAYTLYNYNQLVLSSGKEEILGHLGQVYYLPFYLKTASILFLHGGCLLTPNENHAYVFLAPTGGGKTTIISFLLANGYRYFSDDIVPVQEKSLTVHSFPKALYVRDKKFIDSFNKKELIFDTGTKLSLFEESKYVYSVKNKATKAISEITKIFILDRQETYVDIQLEKINGQDSFFELMKNLKDPENMSKSYLSVSHLIKNAEIFQLKYGNGSHQLEEILELLSNKENEISTVN